MDEEIKGTVSEQADFVRIRVLGEEADRARVFKDDKGGIQESNASAVVDQTEERFQNAGAIEPPYNLLTLTLMLEHSNSLRPNIDAYSTNIDGFGHRFEPAIDFDRSDAEQRLAQAIYLDRMKEAASGVGSASPDMPTDEEVHEKKKAVVAIMRAERAKLDHFFSNCVEDGSFVSLRKRTRSDLELTGNGYWEVLRNGAGEVAEFVHLPSFTMRLLPRDRFSTQVAVKVRYSDIAYESVVRSKKFRRYVQVYETLTTFFKEFGDTRFVSANTGNAYQTLEAFKAAEPYAKLATEVVHFKVYSTRTGYGIPRWIGALLCVLGSRQSEEINYLYFENKSVPPLAVLVSGGRLTNDSTQRLENYVEQNLKGKKNFHKMLIIEADSAANDSSGPILTANNGRMKVDLKPLTDAQQKDALFQEYDESNQDKVGMQFRLPRLLRGDVRDFNRATADAAADLAEQQVFGGEREEFDWFMTNKIFPLLGIRFWRYKSQGAKRRTPTETSTIIKEQSAEGNLTPNEARQLLEDVFDREFSKLSESFGDQPMKMTLAGMTAAASSLSPYTGEESGVGQERAEYDDYDADGESDATQPAQPAQITRTALGHVVSVNEARKMYGLGPKLLPNGQPDPDGEMSVSEFQAKKLAGYRAPATQDATSEKDAGGTTTVGDFASGGIRQAEQQAPAKASGRRGRQLSKFSRTMKELLEARAAIQAAELEKARAEFKEAKEAEPND